MIKIIDNTKIQLNICRENAFTATEWEVAFTTAAIIEKDKAEIIINNFALLSFEITIFKILKLKCIENECECFICVIHLTDRVHQPPVILMGVCGE